MTGNLFDELKRRKVFKVGAAYLDSLALLALDPVWDPIRGDVQFQSLIASK